ncbi:hypothetical protein JG687_00018622 [Phytophthora cactorum]|uniref:Uncharacterized protein n=1 Tax=Phytophthora cactorum TaxID=29920 RepID=A0A329S980_9STRA|nr:hypothetical protein PC111_g11570 [Phytophthora cactorum]KAG2825569.1 hypothetical protein PC112_g9664 [Phytophthora cactorum]KAG2854475.1 hypothetical protein PC113_g13280 [Phytophthora cactorum]KAG2912653.1 hypothetical protein PC115_g12287 [Phytophthora cactorum]KAG2965355.1 hypothetical protein PC119_g25011 [Phytophthora cactorum]
MVFGEEYSDDEGERNVGRGKVRGDHDEEHPVSVPKAVARLERATGGQLSEGERGGKCRELLGHGHSGEGA